MYPVYMCNNVLFTFLWKKQNKLAGLHTAVGSTLTADSKVSRLNPQLGHITFMMIEQEIISTVILPILLIQEGQLMAKVVAQSTG